MVRRADQRRATRAETRRREADEARAAAAAAVGGGGGSPSDSSEEGDDAADSDAGGAAAGVPVSHKMFKEMKKIMKRNQRAMATTQQSLDLLVTHVTALDSKVRAVSGGSSTFDASGRPTGFRPGPWDRRWEVGGLAVEALKLPWF